MISAPGKYFSLLLLFPFTFFLFYPLVPSLPPLTSPQLSKDSRCWLAIDIQIAMSSHPTRSDQSDRTITSSVTGFDQLHVGLRWQPDQQQQQQQLALQHQQQQEGGPTLQYQQHGQQVGSDLPQSMRRIQPQPSSSTPIPQTHNAFVYPQSSNSPLLQSVHSSEDTPENDHDMKRLRVSRAW